MPLSRRENRTRATRSVEEFAQAHNKEANAKSFSMQCFKAQVLMARSYG
jgi:hypothetical protein